MKLDAKGALYDGPAVKHCEVSPFLYIVVEEPNSMPNSRLPRTTMVVFVPKKRLSSRSNSDLISVW